MARVKLAGSIAATCRCGAASEGYRGLNFSKRWFECHGVIMSSHGGRLRNNYMNEKSVFLAMFSFINGSEISGALCMAACMLGCSISSFFFPVEV